MLLIPASALFRDKKFNESPDESASEWLSIYPPRNNIFIFQIFYLHYFIKHVLASIEKTPSRISPLSGTHEMKVSTSHSDAISFPIFIKAIIGRHNTNKSGFEPHVLRCIFWNDRFKNRLFHKNFGTTLQAIINKERLTQ